MALCSQPHVKSTLPLAATHVWVGFKSHKQKEKRGGPLVCRSEGKRVQFLLFFSVSVEKSKKGESGLEVFSFGQGEKGGRERFYFSFGWEERTKKERKERAYGLGSFWLAFGF